MGICCQKLDEVEAIAAAPSIRDVLLTNEVVGTAKLNRLFALVRLLPARTEQVLTTSVAA